VSKVLYTRIIASHVSNYIIASSQPCSHSHGSPKSKEMEALEKAEELDKEFLDIASFLEAQFGPVELNEKEKTILVNMDGIDATVDTIKFVSSIELFTIL
jgi:hypothetical protein